MAENPHQRPRPGLRRLLFLLAVIIPFVPEIAIRVVVAIARLQGCAVDQEKPCLIGSWPANDLIAFWLQATSGFATAHADDPVWLIAIFSGIAVWLVACYALLLTAWSGTASRLLLGLALALVFGLLPYFGPLLAIRDLAHANCDFNAATCRVFGGDLGQPGDSAAYHAGELGWFALAGAPLAAAIFVMYAVAVIILTARSRSTAPVRLR